MRLGLLIVGKRGAPWADAGVGVYAKRLRPLGGLEEVHVRPQTYRGDEAAVREAEGARILKRVGPRDRLVVLDERGDDLDTPGFATLLREARASGAPRVWFAIGGPYGHAPATRSRAWRVVRLSSLVLNHDLARVVLVEQLYRAWTLLEGRPYHH